MNRPLSFDNAVQGERSVLGYMPPQKERAEGIKTDVAGQLDSDKVSTASNAGENRQYFQEQAIENLLPKIYAKLKPQHLQAVMTVSRQFAMFAKFSAKTFTPKSIESLKQFVQLPLYRNTKKLVLRDCSGFEDHDMELVRKFPELEELDCSGIHVSDNALKIIGGMKQLKPSVST